MSLASTGGEYCYTCGLVHPKFYKCPFPPQYRGVPTTDIPGALRAERRRVVEALGKWLHHKNSCKRNRPGLSVSAAEAGWPCTCGLAAKLAELEKPHG